MTKIVDSLNAKKGGIWRYIQRDPAGNEYAHNGVSTKCHRLNDLSKRTNSKAFQPSA
ncbi:SRPBCC family protein [Paenibacillus oceani]|uniref:hypothetical protein n=1 Tax=Paenibacillus oceani TaxID=2772510 RepID=UPI001CC263F3|nr:hypothetical protein [Paenibacillus oceani]